jgi:hypothetical protein
MAIQQNDLFRGTLNWRMANQRCANVFHFRADTLASGTTGVNQMLGGMMSKLAVIAGAITTNVHESIIMESANLVTIHGGTSAYARQQDLNTNGLRQGDLLPGFVAAPIFWGTDYAGRSRRGRTHVGGWLEEDQDAGVLETAALDRLEFIRDAVLGQVSSGTNTMVVYSRKIAVDTGLPAVGQPVPSNPDDIATPWAPIQSGVLSPVLGSMYSRRIGIGS